MDFKTRKSYFTLFFIDVQHLPIKYQSFVYRRSELKSKDKFIARMRRDITNLLFDSLEFFQSFDRVKTYYDEGKDLVMKTLRAAFDYVLSKESILYRKTKSADYILAQAADMICTLELTAVKYSRKEATKTDEKMFGFVGSFKTTI